MARVGVPVRVTCLGACACVCAHCNRHLLVLVPLEVYLLLNLLLELVVCIHGSRWGCGVTQAIRDGVIDAAIDDTTNSLFTKEAVDAYSTGEPQAAFDRRIKFCLDVHNDAVTVRGEGARWGVCACARCILPRSLTRGMRCSDVCLGTPLPHFCCGASGHEVPSCDHET